MLNLEHMKLVQRDEAEVTKVVKGLRAATGATPFGILHEKDDSCCRRERWDDTLNFLLALTARDDIRSSMSIDLRDDNRVPLTPNPGRN